MSRLAGRGRGCRRLGRYHAGVQMHPLPFHSPKSCSTGMGAMLVNPRLCRSTTECGGQGAGRNCAADQQPTGQAGPSASYMYGSKSTRLAPKLLQLVQRLQLGRN